MDDGIRTHDHLDHNQGLCQLSYIHHHYSFLARPAGLEPAACGLEIRCSIHLSYGRTGNRPGTRPSVKDPRCSSLPRADANNGYRTRLCQDPVEQPGLRDRSLSRHFDSGCAIIVAIPGFQPRTRLNRTDSIGWPIPDRQSFQQECPGPPTRVARPGRQGPARRQGKRRGTRFPASKTPVKGVTTGTDS